MQATNGPIIKTRFMPPTDRLGPRVKATHKRDSRTTWKVTISEHQGCSDLENHRNAALELIYESPMKDWQTIIVASAHDADGYYFICSNAPISPA